MALLAQQKRADYVERADLNAVDPCVARTHGSEAIAAQTFD
jgi:hypothetical protein